MSVNPKYYYNLSGNITDGKKEYSLHHKEDKIGGLSISSGLKENHIEYGTNSLLDLLNKLNNENKELRYKYDEQSNEKMGLEEDIDRLLKDNNEFRQENEELKKFVKVNFNDDDGKDGN